MEREGNKIKSKNIILERILVFSMYFFLLFGGLWNILGLFTDLMEMTAGIVVILVSIFTIYEYAKDNSPTKVIIFALIVIVASFLLEYIGVTTGAIFGSYEYGQKLTPQIWGVPIAIGFAWISILLSSHSLLQRLNISAHFKSDIITAVIVGILMTFFDFFMEPASQTLGYWTWTDGEIPIQNYLAWTVFGSIFSYLGLKLKAITNQDSNLAYHAFIAQLIYFLMLYLK